MTKTFVLQNQKKSADFKIDYQKELNQEQYRAVSEGNGPCLVLAGAGSGKTRTIVYRVAYLIEHGIKSENILLVTFTNKAAREMLERVEALLGRYPDKLWGGTFHHIGNRLLRQYAVKVGYEPNFTILDEEDSQALIKVCLKEAGIDLKARRFPSAAVIKDLISFAKNSQIPLIEVITTKHPKWLEIENQIQNISRQYEVKKQKNNSMDFDDLLVNWLRLLKQEPAIKDRLGTQFHYILVDEYQDTNYIQAEIIKELSCVHHNVLVVGDDAQSIYSFRAADIGNILNFPANFPQTKIFKLETNYRSTPEILSVANKVISQNVNQYPKLLRPMLKSFVKPNLVPATSAAEEAQFISQMILQLRDEGLALNKMAVLFRAAYHSQELEFELTKRDIPYDYRGGVRFFERSHIKDACAFLKVINNLKDEVAWLRVLNLQTGIGEVTAGKIYQRLKDLKTMAQVSRLDISDILTPKSAIGWRGLAGIFDDLKSVIDDQSVSELIRAVAKSDYQNYLESQFPNWQERLEDLEQLAKFAENYMSLNAEVVFVINLIDAAFPNQRALSEDGGLEEERRLFYVAITRAKQQLFFSYPVTGSHASMYLNTPSQFLGEIPAELMEKVKLIDDSRWIKNEDLDDGEVQYLPEV